MREPEFDHEMREHLRLLTERFVRQGMSPQEAEMAARRQFGNVTKLDEDRHELQTVRWAETLSRDIRFGARQLVRTPLFTITAVLSLALGIGANTAVFTLLDQLVLRLLPVAQPERLVMIWTTGPHFGNNIGQRFASYPMYQDFERKSEAFEAVFCRVEIPASLTADGNTERIRAELVSGNFFQALRVGAAVGRLFSPESDDRVFEGHPSVVLSHRYWMNRFGGDPAIVGKKLLVNSYPMEIVGVSAAGFAGVDPASTPDVRVPILMAPVMTPHRDDLTRRRSQWVQMFARLKPGFTVEKARASLQPLLHQILEQEVDEPALRRLNPTDRERFLKRTAMVETAASGYSGMRQQYATALTVLMSMAGLILLIACSNVASLLTARGAARQKEMAVRLAVGASRSTLVRQLLVESILLSLGGTALGLALAVEETRGLLGMLPGASNLMLRAIPDERILLFGIGVALLTGIMFGVAPAIQATKPDLLNTLKDVVGAVAGGRGSTRLRKILVTAQVALSFLLLMGAGLFARTLANLKNTRTGFEGTDNLVSFQIDPGKAGYNAGRTRNLYSDALRETRALPGVKSAAYAMWPLLNGHEWDLTIAVEGHTAAPNDDMQVYYNLVSPGFWNTMGVRMLEGRDFDDRDRVDGGDDPQPWNVAIVNSEFAEHYFPGQNAVGRHVGCCHGLATKTTIRIVGVVENSLFGGPRNGMRRQVFLPYLESSTPAAVTYYVRGSTSTTAMFPVLRGVIAKLDQNLPVYEWKTLAGQLDETLSTERLIALLSAVFGLLATVLAAMGLYGVLASQVARRTREIGLRVALGAPRRWVLWLVMREVLMLLGGGLLVGVPAAYGLSRYISSQLFGVTPSDLLTGVAAIMLLTTVAVAAGLVPARRASALDPITALRYE